MDMNAALNIAVGCLMASPLPIEIQKEVIQELRKCGREIEQLRDIVDSCVCGDYESK